MKRLIWVAVVVIGVLVIVQQVKNKRNAEGALAILEPSFSTAREEGKNVMLVFTGLDWCTWCIKLEHEILSQEAFLRFSDDNLVMVTADFPEKSSSQPEDVRKRNAMLQSAFNVSGFPTVFLLSPDGEVLAKMGYEEGGPSAYIEHIKTVLAKTQ